MANLSESAVWESNVYQLATDDPVLGGENGIANRQPSQLANRTLYLKTNLDALTALVEEIAERILPIGSILAHSVGSVPDGFLSCDGAAISRATYAALFAVIGTAYGVGDTETTFNVPDLRGEFLRGWDDGRGVDTDRVIGSAQGDALETHNHYMPVATNTPGNDYGLGSDAHPAWEKCKVDREVSNYVAVTYPRASYTDGDEVGDTGTFAAETRPRNIAVQYIIKC